MTVAYLADTADAVLQAALAGLAQATTGRAPPSHVFLSHGPPALDQCCDAGQLTVHHDMGHHTYPYDPSGAVAYPAGGASCDWVYSADLVITLARCVPSLGEGGYVPSTSALDASAEDLLVDLWAILTELYDRIRAKTLFAGQMECADAVLGDVLPLEPEGGCGGWTIRLSVEANDAGPLGS